jgi:hypothetical protein
MVLIKDQNAPGEVDLQQGNIDEETETYVGVRRSACSDSLLEEGHIQVIKSRGIDRWRPRGGQSVSREVNVSFPGQGETRKRNQS